MYFPIIDALKLKENFIAKIPSIVTKWLTDNVDPVGSAVVVDKSLSISGAAADAKVTGDEISDLKSDFGGITKSALVQTFEATSDVRNPGTPFMGGIATRYAWLSDIKKVKVFVKFSLEEDTDALCEVRDGDNFDVVLGSAVTTVSPNANAQYVEFTFAETIKKSSDNVYIAVSIESGTLISSGRTFDTCTATSTQPNRYKNGGDWVYVSGNIGYCMYVWYWDEMLYAKSQIIYVGNTPECDYTNIQDAITNCNDSETNPVIIFVRNGNYNEFSMIDGMNRVRYISIIGESRENVIVKGDKGNYDYATAEIRIIGVIKNITFIQKATPSTYIPGGRYPYCYAMHDDFDDTNAEYENCTFISNAGPAVGIGTRANGMKVFRNCYFENNSDGTYGSQSIGAFFGHSYWANAENQGLLLENCTAINRSGANGIYIDKLTQYTATFNAHIRNCWSYGNGVAAAYCTIDLTDSFGNNVNALNVF